MTLFTSSIVLAFAAMYGSVGSNFTVNYVVQKPAILVTGQEFALALKTPGGVTDYRLTDTTVKTITFDNYGAEYNDVVNNASSIIDVATEDSVGDALMYHVGNSTDGYDVYVLSAGNIYANADCSSMFTGCETLSNMTFNNFDTGNVTNMSMMFYQCEVLETLDVGSWNTGSVTDMSMMFEYCSGLMTLNVSGWDTRKVTTMNNMFSYASRLEMLDLTSWSTSKVTDMAGMFINTSFTVLDLSGFDTSSVNNMYFMFRSCSVLTTIYVGDKWSTAEVTNGANMFLGCINLVGGNGTEWSQRYVTYTYARVDTASTPGYLTLKS